MQSQRGALFASRLLINSQVLQNVILLLPLDYLTSAQRLALPAGGRDEITSFYRNPFEATETPKKRAESHLSGARFVRQLLIKQDFMAMVWALMC